MMKWAVINIKKTGDEFMTVCEGKAEVINEAALQWSRLTASEKKNARIVAGTVNLDETNNYKEIDGKIDADIYEIAAEYEIGKMFSLEMVQDGDGTIVKDIPLEEAQAQLQEYKENPKINEVEPGDKFRIINDKTGVIVEEWEA